MRKKNAFIKTKAEIGVEVHTIPCTQRVYACCFLQTERRISSVESSLVMATRFLDVSSDSRVCKLDTIIGVAVWPCGPKVTSIFR